MFMQTTKGTAVNPHKAERLLEYMRFNRATMEVVIWQKGEKYTVEINGNYAYSTKDGERPALNYAMGVLDGYDYGAKLK